MPGNIGLERGHPLAVVLSGQFFVERLDDETVAERIRRALPFVDASNVVVAPDCGLKYLPRATAYGKMKAMVDGAAIVRAELS